MKNSDLVALLVILAAPIAVAAQRGGPAPPTARAASPIDLTGYWVSLVTNEWKWRMLTPQKGDYAVLPINAEARRAADTWDPARDEANGEQCRGFGAAVIMQAPGRLHITWDGDETLKVETDAGTQTRLFRFNRTPPPAGPPAWQGHSVAQWLAARGQGRETRAAGAPSPTARSRVVTTRMRPGYLRQKRRAVQRRGDRHRVLQSLFRSGSRLLQRHGGRRRSCVPDRSVHPEHAVQERARWREMESLALLGQVTTTIPSAASVAPPRCWPVVRSRPPTRRRPGCSPTRSTQPPRRRSPNTDARHRRALAVAELSLVQSADIQYLYVDADSPRREPSRPGAIEERRRMAQRSRPRIVHRG